MVDRLAKDIEAHGNHLTTGFLGTPFLMFVLDENQHTDLAFKLLLTDTYPSWGYMVSKCFHHLTIQPHFDPALPTLHVEYDSSYGTIVSDWQQSQHRFTITIPPNSTATVILPTYKTETIGSGTHVYIVP